MTTERDIQNQIEYAHEEGLKEGEAKGREEGREEERLALAANFKAQGVPIKVISEATGLTEQQIQNL